jgi:predicted membrane protein
MDSSDLTASQRWKAIPYQLRVVCIYCALSFVLGAAILARMDTTTNRYLESATGIQPNAIAFLLWAVIPVMFGAYYVWRNLLVIMLGLSPVVGMAVILGRQIVTSETAPLIHLVSFGFMLVSIPLLYLFSAETDEKDVIIQALKVKVSTLETQVKVLEEKEV